MRGDSLRQSLIRSLLVATLFTAPLTGTSPVWSGEPAHSLTKQDVEAIVQEYIMAHPDVLLQSVEALRARQEAEKKEAAHASLVSRKADLFEDPSAPVAGATGNVVRVVEFFDYRCGFCKRTDPTIMALIAQNPNVRVIFKEFPILGPESTLAAKAALAAHRQGAYLKFHASLMGSNEPVSQASLETLAVQLGLNLPQFKTDIESPEIHETIERNQLLAQTLNVNSTPTFVVESELVEGALDEEAFNKLIAKAQAEKTTH